MTTETPVIDKKKVTSRIPKEPGKYKVIVCNDDVTPVEFVVAMLIGVFNFSQNDALKLTIQVHNDGSAVAGTYTYEVAEQKSVDAIQLARSNGYPLVLKVESE
jgi:ATP-dependent Clp protease adaptor protein ClpS